MDKAIMKAEKRELNMQKLYNALLFACTFMFLGNYSLPGKYLADWIGRLEILVGLAMLFVTFLKFLHVTAEEKKTWIKTYALAILYVAVRLACFVKLGFEYSTLRSLAFETVYLFALSEYLIDSHFIKKWVFGTTVYYTFAINVLNLIAYLMFHFGLVNSALLEKYTFYSPEKYNYISSMYANPNTLGTLTGIALVLAFYLLTDKTVKTSKSFFAVNLVLSLYSLYISDCRSAQLGLIFVICLLILDKLLRHRFKKQLLVLTLAGALIVTAGLGVFAIQNRDLNLYKMNQNNTEYQINMISSGRYFIWKSSILASEDSRLLGSGSLKNQLAERNEYQEKDFNEYYEELIEEGDLPDYIPSDLGPHNGYFSMLFCTGIIASVIFFAFLFMRICKAKSLSKGYLYLVIAFTLIVNMFESMFLLNKFFLCLFMLIVLSMNEEKIGE